jgi:hypothetical protein
MQQCNIRQPACMVATCDVHAPVQAEGAPKDGAIAGTVAKLSIVDLAGSERLKKCGRSVPVVALHCVCGVLHIALRSVAGLSCSCRMSHVACRMLCEVIVNLAWVSAAEEVRADVCRDVALRTAHSARSFCTFACCCSVHCARSFPVAVYAMLCGSTAAPTGAAVEAEV